MAIYHNKTLIDAKFIIALLENSETNVKTTNIIDCIQKGADVNAKFANDFDNTPLHIAVTKGDKEVVNILLRYGARVNIANKEGKTALALAKELPERSDIAKLLADSETAASSEASSITSEIKNAVAITTICEYKKRPGTAGVHRQLYETKLLALIYLRASRCRYLTEFYLGTNVDEIGDMKDVCLRFKTVNDDYVVFLQAKYKHAIVKRIVGIEDLFSTSGDFSLLKYFDSYKQIRSKFNPNSDNEFFRGRYEDLKCYYVIYTTAKDMIECTRKKAVANDDVTDLLGTGEHRNIFQLMYNDQYITELLTKNIMTESIEVMGRKLFKLIQDKSYNVMLDDENIRSFHVMLSQKVIKVLDAFEEQRLGTFREEFFSSNEELLIVLRETLYKEAAKVNQLTTEEINTLISKILKTPEAHTISKLIGNILTYDSNTNTLRLNYEKHVIDRLDDSLLLSRLQVSQSVINEAFEIAGRKKLCSLRFYLPTAFGNLDMTLNKKECEQRLEYLANKISDVINESADAKGYVIIREGMYATNKCLTAGDLAIKGGIAGLVGNLLVSDDNNKLKFNLDVVTLGDTAKMLLLKLKERVIDLHKYRFLVESEDLPRLSLHATEHEKRFVEDFLENLYFYTCQAKENQLEEIETKEIQAHECSDGISKAESRIRSDALYLKVHNEIQIWWMTEETAPYLTRNTFDYIFRDLINKGFLSLVNYIYLNEMDNVGIKFKVDAINALSVCGRDTRNTNMIVVNTDVHLLTCHKLVQLFRSAEDYIFLDINYLFRMSPNFLSIITNELDKMNICNVVIICEDASKFKDVIRACGTRKIILVTTNYVPTEQFISVRDDRINLTDLTDASQRKVLQNKLNFQGIEVTFAEVFDEGTKYLVNSKVLEKIINKEYIIIGETLMQSTYEETKHYYVPRTLDLTECFCDSIDTSSSWDSSDSAAIKNKFLPSTLIDHHIFSEWRRKQETSDIILVLDAPGMGKSTLLTHLSLETKRQYPKIWIQRINLIDHTKQFHGWHENKIEVNSVEALKFVCKVALSKESCRGHVRSSNSRNINLQIVNDEIKVINSDEMTTLEAFELNTFLHCFYKGRTVFLFDGFDEICPHYKREVTQLLKYFARRSPVRNVTTKGCEQQCEQQQRFEQCVWITSRPYNDIKETLEKEFGESYTLEPFYYKDISVFVDKYLRRNLDLNALTSNQLKNIDGFLDYMTESVSDFTVINNLLKSVYVSVIAYFENAIKQSHVTGDNLESVRDWGNKITEIIWFCTKIYNIQLGTGEIPLHVYLAIHFFQNQVQDTILTDTEDALRQWNLDTNTFAFYERFIETKLKTIRFEEKNRMDIYNPDVKITYEKEKKEFLDKHKKLAFYVVCDKKVFPDNELNEIKDIISAMDIAKEKTGFVDRIVDGEPRFIHYTLAEYFAVEYIYDSLKSSETRKLNRMLDYLLSHNIPGILYHFDLKIRSDPSFITAVCTPHVNNYILGTLGQQILNSKELHTTLFTVAHGKGLKYLTTFLIHATICAINDTNFSIFIAIMESDFMNIFDLVNYDHSDIVCKILDCIRRFNTSKLTDLLPFSKSKNIMLSEQNNEEIIKKLREYVKSVEFKMIRQTRSRPDKFKTLPSVSHQ